MSNVLRLMAIVSALLGFGSPLVGCASLTRHSGLSAEQEQALLDRLCPVLLVNPDGRIGDRVEQPCSMTWWLSHCRLVTRDGDTVTEVLAGPLEPGAVLGQVEEAGDGAGDLRFEALPSYDDDERRLVRSGWKPDGSEVGEPRIYGMVLPGTGDVVRVAYFAFYGMSEAFVGAGNHEGDWICVDFDVDVSDPEHPKIVRCFYHNHGRQIMVDDPANNLVYTDGHPHVYPEDTTHELWPTAKGGDDGFNNGDVPSCVYANHRLDGGTIGAIGEFLTGDDAEEHVVRGHDGDKPIKLWEHGGVYNVSPDAPNKDELEHRLFHEFTGRWGTERGVKAENPRSPRHQAKMWDRKFKKAEGVRGGAKGCKL